MIKKLQNKESVSKNEFEIIEDKKTDEVLINDEFYSKDNKELFMKQPTKERVFEELLIIESILADPGKHKVITEYPNSIISKLA